MRDTEPLTSFPIRPDAESASQVSVEALNAHDTGGGVWQYRLPGPWAGYPLLMTSREFGDAGSTADPLTADMLNRLSAVGVSSLVRVKQDHTRRILALSEIGADSPSADGIASGPDGPWLAVTVADCMPIVVLGSGGERFLLHSGWKGTGILENALSRLTDPGAALVFLGPAIDVTQYPVDEPRARSFAAEHGTNAVFYASGRFHLDMYAANLNIARRFGVGRVLGATERSSDPRLPSYRRDGASYTRSLFLLGPQPIAEKA